MDPQKFYEFEPIDFFAYGKRCVETAELLKNGIGQLNKAEADYPMRILLVHGIECLLKAFIQHFNKDEFKKIKRVHDIKKLYDTAQGINVSQNLNILDSSLDNEIGDLETKFYPGSVEARYTNRDSLLNFSIFTNVKRGLIQPLEGIIYL